VNAEKYLARGTSLSSVTLPEPKWMLGISRSVDFPFVSDPTLNFSQAESVSHHLRVPVLRHASPKPSYACIKGIQAYFTSLRPPRWGSHPPPLLSRSHSPPATGNETDGSEIKNEQLGTHTPRDEDLIIVGDRIFTDVVLANRMRTHSRLSPSSQPSSTVPGPGPGTLAIWTTHVWEREIMLMRWAEGRLVKAVEAWTKKPTHSSSSASSGSLGDGNGSENREGDDHVYGEKRFVKAVGGE